MRLFNLCMFICIVASSCTYIENEGNFRENATNDQTAVFKDTRLWRKYILHLSNGKSSLIGYLEKHKVIKGAKAIQFYYIYNRNFKKLGYVDEFGRTYIYKGELKEFVGAGSIELSCKMVLGLKLTDIVIFEKIS